MRYLQTYQLYEAAITEHPLLDGMRNTVGGLDLAALTSDFRVDRTGKLVIEGLRGKTFVQQQPDGTWKHWIVSTGRVYGEGTYATLEECLEGCWMDFVLYSNYVRPSEMNMQAYRDLVVANLSEFQGKALSKQQLRQKVVDLIQKDFKRPIQDAVDFWILPKWLPALNALGLTTESHRVALFHPDSAIVSLFFTPEELEDNFASSYTRLLANRIPLNFHVKVEPWEVLKMEINYSVDLTIGGDLSTLPAFADEVWGSKRLHRAMTTAFAKKISEYDFPEEIQQRMLALRQVGVELLQKVAAGGKVADIVSTLLPVMQDKDFTFSQAKKIREVMPELWQAYVDTHPDPDQVKHSALLGDFF